MPFIKLSSGMEMHYTIPTHVERGRQDPIDRKRPTLFMVHACCVDGRQWHHQVEDPELNQNFNMVSIDLSMCGLTRTPKDWSPGKKALTPGRDGKIPQGQPAISMEQQAEDCAEVIKKLKLPQVHLVGLGTNTAICYYLLLKHPHLFKSATFMSPASLAESDDGKETLNELWSSMVKGCPEELDEATAGFFSLYFGEWAMKDLERRDRWYRMWSHFMPTPDIRRYVFGEWMSVIMQRAPLTIEQVRKGFNVPILVCSGSDHMIHPTAHAELEAALYHRDAACPYFETHHLGHAPTMVAKSHYEEINSILGHFIAAVEGIHLEAPRPNLVGYDESWQQPYDALVKRLEAYQTSGKAPTREMELVTAQQQTISKKSAWKVGFKNLVHALNSGTN